MRPISLPRTAMQSSYEVVVIGSGYGGGIAASRFARAGANVAVLERGREYLPGDFPDTLTEAAAAMQVHGPERSRGSQTALFDFRNHADLDVLVGCGLGGTSLINAGVVVEPDPRVFDDPEWPRAFREDVQHGLAEGFRRARAMLAPSTYPDDRPDPAKFRALSKSAEHLGAPVRKVPLAVTFDDSRQPNPSGVHQSPCIECGDCVSGCNHTSKNTVHVTYLADAYQHGASIFTEVSVSWIEKRNDGWRVHFAPLDDGREVFKAPDLFISANHVVLAAGSLGSTEILLRSKHRGLPVSDELGSRFTGNGDVLAFAYDGKDHVNGVGTGPRIPEEQAPGPCITGMIDTRDPNRPLEDGLSIEEGVIPGAISGVIPAGLAAAATWVGQRADRLRHEDDRDARRALTGLIRPSGFGAIQRTQTFLVMGHDETRGTLSLEDDRLQIDWPDAGDERVAHLANEHLAKATEALGGTYVINPLWSQALGHQLVTVHPLGGCSMGESAQDGVVDHMGRVFAGTNGTDVHTGLYVLDGSIVPRSLGTNPLLTISAVSERAVAAIIADAGMQLDVHAPAPRRRDEPSRTMSLAFTERMAGDVTVVGNEGGGIAPNAVRKASFRFTVTVTLSDIEATLDDPAKGHGTLVGTVTSPALAPDPLSVYDGSFILFDPDPNDPRTRHMRYRMPLEARDGRRFLFEGAKTVRDDEGVDLWSDTTTLAVTVHAMEAGGARGALIAEGALRIAPLDFARQLMTLRVDGAPDRRTRLATIARFGNLFAGALFETYGGIVAPHKRFDTAAPPRKRRELAAPTPVVYPVRTEDGHTLKVTRFEGGSKGPVMLVHGLGVSSRIFTPDTIDVNLVEYLTSEGYDVWTFDWRGSIDVPASQGMFTVDDVARFDHPAALTTVREVTGAKDVHVLAHCVGSITFSASLLGGWAQGVRSTFLTQVATHMRPPAFTRFKTGLHVPGVLKRLGVERLDGSSDSDASWSDRLFEAALRLHPIQAEERCTNPVCRRITFMYGGLFEHDQLNRATHDALHEHFGVANLSVFSHLARTARRGKLVDNRGRDAYLPHIERWSMPTTLLSGAENDCFLPLSTQQTADFLGSASEPPPLVRHEVPDYGHIDVFLGHSAWRDVYPLVTEHLEGV